MANRRDYYFKQLVTEGELDEGFELLEVADRYLYEDQGLFGLMQNGDVTERSGTPNLSVDVSGPGIAYDQLGQRIPWSGAATNVPVNVDEAAASTAVTTPGNSKWLSLFAAFDRDLDDPRTDGTGATVNFERNETVSFNVVQGAEGVSPTRPGLRADEVLLADILLAYGDTQILDAVISKTRTQYGPRRAAPLYQEGKINLDADGAFIDATGLIDTGDTDPIIRDLARVGAGNVFTATLDLIKIAEFLTADSASGLVAKSRLYAAPGGGFIQTYNCWFNNTSGLWTSDANLQATATYIGVKSFTGQPYGVATVRREVAAAAETWNDTQWTQFSSNFGRWVENGGAYFEGADASLLDGQLRFTTPSAIGSNLPKTAAPTPNTLYARNVPKVSGKVQINAGTVTLDEGFGVASVAAASPNFTINFANNFANTDYSFVSNPWYDSGLGELVVAVPTSLAVGSITLKLRRTSDFAEVSIAGAISFIMFQIHGEQ